MKSFVYPLIAFACLASATPISRDVSDTSTDMDDIIAGTKACASTAVIFARGTFDSGNIGVWVGPAYKEALTSDLTAVAFQGVNPDDYPATLEQYLDEDGSESCADGLASTVDAYAAKCPSAKIVVSGWSQGSLCAHKSLDRIGDDAVAQVKALVTFGDPNGIMDNIAVPPTIQFKSYCVEDNLTPDPLCTTLSEGFRLPTSFSDLKDLVIGGMDDLPDLATGVAQTKAAAGLVPDLTKGILDNAGTFAKDLVTGHLRRWLVTPQHFLYGNNGMAAQAAAFIATL